MKRPIPAVIPSFKFLGILLTSASLNLKRERIIKIIPSTNTAVKATKTTNNPKSKNTFSFVEIKITNRFTNIPKTANKHAANTKINNKIIHCEML